MITFACVGEMFWTSMIRGFRKVVALLCIRGYLSYALLRIKFDDQLLVHVVGEFAAVRQRLEDALEVLRVHLDPARKAVLLGEVEGGLDAQLLAGLLAHRDRVGR